MWSKTLRLTKLCSKFVKDQCETLVRCCSILKTSRTRATSLLLPDTVSKKSSDLTTLELPAKLDEKSVEKLVKCPKRAESTVQRKSYLSQQKVSSV